MAWTALLMSDISMSSGFPVAGSLYSLMGFVILFTRSFCGRIKEEGDYCIESPAFSTEIG
jgi:hypothetical protein